MPWLYLRISVTRSFLLSYKCLVVVSAYFSNILEIRGGATSSNIKLLNISAAAAEPQSFFKDQLTKINWKSYNLCGMRYLWDFYSLSNITQIFCTTRSWHNKEHYYNRVSLEYLLVCWSVIIFLTRDHSTPWNVMRIKLV